MAQEEQYGTRDRAYSAWHRRLSTRRFVGIENAQLLAMIDLDASLYVEYDDATKEPLVLIEIARDVGQPYKPFTVTANLAKRTVPVIPAYVVLYRTSEKENPAAPGIQDIEAFRVKRVWPDPQFQWTDVTPEQYANALVRVRAWCTSRLDMFENEEMIKVVCLP